MIASGRHEMGGFLGFNVVSRKIMCVLILLIIREQKRYGITLGVTYQFFAVM